MTQKKTTVSSTLEKIKKANIRVYAVKSDDDSKKTNSIQYPGED